MDHHSTYHHTGSNSDGGKVLKIGHIPPDVLVDGVEEVTDPRQEGDQQKNLIISQMVGGAISIIYTAIKLYGRSISTRNNMANVPIWRHRAVQSSVEV